MARFTMDTGTLNGDTAKVEAYLYKLNRTLEYMFTHLNPEDNYSEEARLIYVAEGERQSKIEVSLEQISLSMVDKDEIIAAINLSEEGVQIKGDKISLEGVVTVNNYFSIGLDGSMYATNGHFSGEITASAISSSTINIARGQNIGLYCNGTDFRFGDFEVNDAYGRQILESSDEVTGMSGEPNTAGQLYLWAGYYGDSNYAFVVNNNKETHVQGYLIVNGTDVMDAISRINGEIDDLWEAIESIDTGGGGEPGV